MKNNSIINALLIIAGLGAAYGIYDVVSHRTASHGDHSAHGGHGAGEPAEYERGPHSGRMLRKDDFAVEITIFEDGVPPEFHLYAYENDKPIAPQDFNVTVTLARIDGEKNAFKFIPVEDYLKSDGQVVEPHSFDVIVTADSKGASYQWTYESYEGRTKIDAEAAKASGIKIEKAGPAIIADILNLSGKIVLNANTTAKIRARFPGIVREVKKGLGDKVEAGDILATIESNDSLQVYAVKAPTKGIILARDTNVGDVAGDTPLFTIADLSTVWAEFHVFPGDIARVQPDQPVEVSGLEEVQKGEGTIASLLPLAESSTQTIIARVPLDNTEGLWRAGMTVQGKVTIAKREVPLAVKSSGLQRFRDFTVVFGQFGDLYEVRMLELGQDDGTYVEVLEGIKPDTPYVSENSFLIRADIEKSGASHDH